MLPKHRMVYEAVITLKKIADLTHHCPSTNANVSKLISWDFNEVRTV